MDEKQAEINAYKNLLEQNDYTGRKIAFEVARLFKEQFPDASMPEYEKYLETETLADTFRSQIEALEVLE